MFFKEYCSLSVYGRPKLIVMDSSKSLRVFNFANLLKSWNFDASGINLYSSSLQPPPRLQLDMSWHLVFAQSLIKLIFAYLNLNSAKSATFCIDYSNTTKNNILFVDISSSRRKSSSGLTSGTSRQYVKACPIHGSIAVSYTHLTLPTNREV